MEKFNFEDKKVWVTGLLFDCPFGKELDECLTKETRSLPVSGRIELVKSMEPHQVDLIIANHRECMSHPSPCEWVGAVHRFDLPGYVRPVDGDHLHAFVVRLKSYETGGHVKSAVRKVVRS